jgi:hypothetical protein
MQRSLSNQRIVGSRKRRPAPAGTRYAAGEPLRQKGRTAEAVL